MVRSIISPSGKAGIIVPTGIATDSFNQYFFADLVRNQSIVSLYDFENREAIFSSVHRSYKFSLLSMSGKPVKQGNFGFFLTQPRQLDNSSRTFPLLSQDIALLNPNTLTCPIFRNRIDAELTKKIYQRVPVLENERTGENPWGVSFKLMFMMNTDSNLFKNESDEGLVPLYEGKMVQAYDHRAASVVVNSKNQQRAAQPSETSTEKHLAPNYFTNPQYWVSEKEVYARLSQKNLPKWLLGFKSVTSPTNERTFIATFLPIYGVGNSMPLIMPTFSEKILACCLLANFNSLIFDFVAKQKVGGLNLNFFIIKQLPVIPPEGYSSTDIEFITPRVLELVYTAWDMKPFAQDMGYDGEPFIWNPERRALLRAELDAYYAHLYGLTREELRYILDPTDIHGPDFPSETFRVLKKNEMKQFGEYRTQRLVLEAWDKLSF